MESMDGSKEYPYHAEAPSHELRDTGNHISTAQLQRLVSLLDESDVSEIEVKRAIEGMHLVLRKAKVPASHDPGEYRVVASASAEMVAPVETKYTVIAQLVGIFHTWGRPKGKDLIALGDRVKVGQPLGTIQSLNVLNEVESSVAGRVVEVLVQDGQAVEYGQQLMVIDSAEGA